MPGDDAAHFNQPTGVAIAPDGSFYVSDGYGNSRVIRFSAEEQYLGEWGTASDGPDGALYVGEVSTGRRVQKFQ